MFWREIQKNTFTSWEKLADYLELSASDRNHLIARSAFPLNCPQRLAEKITKRTLEDPILRQFVPLVDEEVQAEGFKTDPVSEASFRHGPRLLQKYQGRALLVTTSACAMHCRFCFRRHFPYEKSPSDFAQELEELASDPTITEVILSGGDPLSLSNEKLQALIGALETIPHIKRLRYHTRFPIGIPERIDEGFLALLSQTRLATFFVIHCNHVRELDPDVLAALAKIQKCGIPILNQTVLLRGVNNTFEALKELFETLVNHKILPYYLHQLDRVAGSHHFEVETSRGLELMRALEAHLPGYALPKYVREVPGEPSKSTVI